MDCQQYTNILHVYLDEELAELPQAAQMHTAICPNCMAMTKEFVAMRDAARTVQNFRLTEAAQRAVITGVQGKIAASTGSRTQIFATIWRQLRWSRALAAAAVVAALLYVALLFEGDQQPLQTTALSAEEEIEILLEEHSWQMENGIFQPATVPPRVVLTAASARK